MARLDSSDAAVFARALATMRRSGVPFLVGGAYAVYQYSGVWRDTKDLDLLILPQDRERAEGVLRELGLQDYFTVEPYDRGWIFRAHLGATIVDLIWQFANRVDQINPGWFARSRTGTFVGEPARFAGPEDLIWMKLFVFQRTRCDWVDIVSMIRGLEGRLDWSALLGEAGPHAPLLQALVQFYDWLCPGECHFIPASFRSALAERARRVPSEPAPCRASLLDSRPWLAEPGGAMRR